MNADKFKIYSLGCKVNRYDSRYFSACLTASGLDEVNEGADLTLINTCCVTGPAIRKSRRAISKAKSENPDAFIVVCGCWPRAYSPNAQDIGADLVVGDKDATRVIGVILDKTGIGPIPGSDGELVSEDRARYFLKAQDGCEQFCTYCVIPHTRGPLKSRGADEVIAEAEAATRAGFREIVLTGIHLGAFGVDRAGEGDLARLVRSIVHIPNFGRIRLSSIEINEITEDIIDLMVSEDKMCPHLHIPLQAGSNKILKAMNRPYTKEFFTQKVRDIKSRMDKVDISVDVIVGFPGETNEYFEETKALIKELGISKVHTFPFSPHPLTPAFHFPGRVSTKEKARRSRELRELSREQEAAFRHGLKGRIVNVVAEGAEDGCYHGKSEYYFDVNFSRGDIVGKEDTEDLTGRIVSVRLD
jgi:threonylcarbamoyladenosine tRNA methylthiotransferase MtaB